MIYLPLTGAGMHILAYLRGPECLMSAAIQGEQS